MRSSARNSCPNSGLTASKPGAGCIRAFSYGSCRSLWLWHLVGVGVPALVGLLGAVLVAASP